MLRLAIRLPIALSLALLSVQPVFAGQAVDRTSVEVVKVQGVIDPVVADYVLGTIEDAERSGATVVLQIDSRGTYGDEALRLGRALRDARVPVVAWIGPAGARAAGGALFLVYGSGLSAMAPGAGMGPARPFDLSTTADAEGPAVSAEGRRQLEGLALGTGVTAEGIDALMDEALAAGPALDVAAVEVVAPDEGSATLPGLLAGIDGMEVRTAAGPVTLSTIDRSERRIDVRFHDMGPGRRVLHAVATPTAFYVLLIVAMWGIAFEFTQPGVGLAGIAGVLSLALAVYSLTVIPVSWLGLALILAGTALQVLDVVIRRVALLTLTGTALFAVGSVLAWNDVAPAVDVSPWLIGFATLGGLLFFGFGMTVAIQARERVRRSQVGLVGLVGEARADLDPEGSVHVKGTLWRARSMDGPIPKGTRVRVRGIDGLILRVEREHD